ncbi:MAG: prepilin peptidase, partial [Candidatus Cloacimonetes bacterium]|nr:prepilin peptidase [Candidatus Cloacimonadota bacterium]
MLFTFYFLLFTLGVSVGSFLNVIIDRLHTVEPIIAARSHCDHCGQTLRWHDLIPIFSFLWLRGRCRYCGKALSLQYPLVEIAAGLIFILGFSQIKDSQFFIFHFSFFIFIASAMIVIFVYDLKHKIIPDQIVLPAIAITFLFRLFCKDQPCGPQGWSLFTIPFAGALLNPLLSASIAGLFFLCLILATKGRGMGF